MRMRAWPVDSFYARHGPYLTCCICERDVIGNATPLACAERLAFAKAIRKYAVRFLSMEMQLPRAMRPGASILSPGEMSSRSAVSAMRSRSLTGAISMPLTWPFTCSCSRGCHSLLLNREGEVRNEGFVNTMTLVAGNAGVAQDVSHDAATATRKTGQVTGTAAKDTVHATKTTGKNTAKTTAKAGRKVGHIVKKSASRTVHRVDTAAKKTADASK